MINSVQNYKILCSAQLEKQMPDKSQNYTNLSFKRGFERLEDNGIFNTGGMGVWNKKTQRMISRSLSKDKLAKLMQLLEETENERILFCNIYRCGIFKRRLKAQFMCSHILNNFTEFFKQKIFESKWDFINRMLSQFDAYKDQLRKRNVKI